MTKAGEKPIRLLICDDQAIVCEGLRAIVEPVSQIEVVGVANNGNEANELTRTLQPDLVLSYGLPCPVSRLGEAESLSCTQPCKFRSSCTRDQPRTARSSSTWFPYSNYYSIYPLGGKV